MDGHPMRLRAWVTPGTASVTVLELLRAELERLLAIRGVYEFAVDDYGPVTYTVHKTGLHEAVQLVTVRWE